MSARILSVTGPVPGPTSRMFIGALASLTERVMASAAQRELGATEPVSSKREMNSLRKITWSFMALNQGLKLLPLQDVIIILS